MYNFCGGVLLWKKYLCQLNKLKQDILNNNIQEDKKSKMLRESENDIRKEIQEGLNDYFNEE
jgi:hypothetical protein